MLIQSWKTNNDTLFDDFFLTDLRGKPQKSFLCLQEDMWDFLKHFLKVFPSNIAVFICLIHKYLTFTYIDVKLCKKNGNLCDEIVKILVVITYSNLKIFLKEAPNIPPNFFLVIIKLKGFLSTSLLENPENFIQISWKPLFCRCLI